MIFIKPIHKFKIFKADAAPFFFYVEILPTDFTAFKSERTRNLLKKIDSNPIMPLPMRVDRVFNGEKSVLIRPREPISFSVMDDYIATINPYFFLQFGIEKLLYFTEIRAYEKFFISLPIEKVQKWWNSTEFRYTKLLQLEEDFSEFLNLYITNLLKAKLNHEDLINAATKYCQLIQEICEKRIKQNSILIETVRNEEHVPMYEKKLARYVEKKKRVEKIEYHPELVDIEIFDLSEKGFIVNKDQQYIILDNIKPKGLKYIPILFYDDLLECMLHNLKRLEDGNTPILDPSFLIDNKIITLQKSKEVETNKLQEYSWLRTFDTLEFESTLQSIKNTLIKYLETKTLDR